MADLAPINETDTGTSAQAGSAPVSEIARDAVRPDRGFRKSLPFSNPAAPDYDALTPEVSIIILNFNKSDLTRDCLQHLWKYTHGIRYEIIVVDNGSAPAEFVKVSELSGDFKLIRLNANRFFGEGNNVGVEASRGRYIVFLNNDAFVTDNWLVPLISVLENDTGAGGVGPIFLYPDGRMQEAGAFLDAEGIAIQRGKHYRLEEFKKADAVDYCSAACFAMRREVFDRVAGFDASFEPAYYEDSDLCLKIASLGLLIYCCPQSVVHHVENGTASIWGRQLGFDSVVEINRHKLLARWGDYLANRAPHNLAAPRPLAAHPSHVPAHALAPDPVAVFYTPYEIVPGGGERYMLTAAAALTNSHRVYVATDVRYSSYRMEFMGRALSLDLSRVQTIAVSELHNIGEIDVFFNLGNHAIPSAHGRGRRNFFMCQFPFPVHEAYIADNWENLRTYDEIIVNSAFTHDVLRPKINSFQADVNITVLSPPVPIKVPIIDPQAKKTARPIILGIGRFFTGGHNKRHDVLIDTFRELTAAGVDAELHLVGSVHPGGPHMRHYGDLILRAKGWPIHFHGNATPDVLADLLGRASIYWHATGFGIDAALKPEMCEHFGISILEAMASGCAPFVVANGGPREFVIEGETGFQYTTIDELVEKTRDLLGKPDELARIQENARRASQQFSETAFVQKWRALVGVS